MGKNCCKQQSDNDYTLDIIGKSNIKDTAEIQCEEEIQKIPQKQIQQDDEEEKLEIYIEQDDAPMQVIQEDQEDPSSFLVFPVLETNSSGYKKSAKTDILAHLCQFTQELCKKGVCNKQQIDYVPSNDEVEYITQLFEEYQETTINIDQIKFSCYNQYMSVFFESKDSILYFVFVEPAAHVEQDKGLGLKGAQEFFNWQMQNIFYNNFQQWKVVLTGYSLGGYIAECLSQLIEDERVLQCESFNAVNNPNNSQVEDIDEYFQSRIDVDIWASDMDRQRDLIISHHISGDTISSGKQIAKTYDNVQCPDNQNKHDLSNFLMSV